MIDADEDRQECPDCGTVLEADRSHPWPSFIAWRCPECDDDGGGS